MLALAGCGGDDDGGGATEEVTQTEGCTTAEQPEPKQVDLDKPTEKLDPDKTYTVTFETNCGDFTVELDVKNNPKTAASFKHLVDEGLYDDTWFHRVVQDFVIQGGDPAADGTGDAGYQIVEEPTGDYQLGTVAMAKSGADPAGASSSQFFVITGQGGVELDPDYAIAGKVIEGDETIERIAALADPNDTTGTGAPSDVALIVKATSAEQ